MSTISTTITTAVTLTTAGSYTSPLTITSTGAVKNNNAVAAIYAPTGIAKAVITNAGQIIDTKGAGIYIAKSGTITNLGANALISGGDYGIYTGSSKLSTITNQGTIRATSITGIGIYLPEAGLISNTGTIAGGSGTKASGIKLTAGGTVQNVGTTALISAGGYGIDATGTLAETILNQGIITGSANDGILLAGGGTVSNAGTIRGGQYAVIFQGTNSNQLIIDPGAVFIGDVIASSVSSSTLYLAAGLNPGTLSGLGIKYQGFSDVSIAAGANWAITGSNSFTTGILTDSGTLTVNPGATLTGKSTATLDVTGILLNQGTINGAAITLAGGYLLNQAAGLVIGASSGIAARSGSINNQGNIRATGNTGAGISLTAGTIINSGSIIATGTGGDGIYLQAGGTIIDSGAISGGKYAVLFGSVNSDRLIIEPGAVFTGTVKSANTTSSTLEFAANPAAATITGFGTSFTGFATIAIDSGTSLTFTGANTISGQLIDSAALIIAPGATLNIAGGLSATANATLGAASHLAIGGPIAPGETLNLNGTGAVLQLGSKPSTQDTIAGFTIGDTIDLAFASSITGAVLTTGNQLVVDSANSANNITIALNPSANYHGDIFNTNTDAATGGFDITVAIAPPRTFIWGGASTAPFATATSWLGGADYPGTLDTALFNLAAAGPYTVTGNASLASLIVDDNVTLTGSISASSGVTLSAAGANIGTLTIGDVLLTPTVTLQNALAKLIISNNSALTVAGALGGNGTVDLEAGASLIIKGTISAAESINFQGTNTVLQLDSGVGIDAAQGAQTTLHGFSIGDTIDLAFDTQVTGVFLDNGNQLLVANTNDANYVTIALDPAQSYHGDIFNAVTDTATGGFDIVESLAPPRTFVWAGLASAAFSAPSSWQADSDYPGTIDTALFDATYGGPFTLTGNGVISTLLNGDSLTLAGSIDALSGVTIDALGPYFFNPVGTLWVDDLLVSPTISLDNASAGLVIAAGATVVSEIVGSLGGTIIVGGTIIGAGDAINVSGTGSVLLVDDPTAVIMGTVAVSASAQNTLELAAGTIGRTVTGIGTNFIGFTNIEIDPTVEWMALGTHTIVGNFIDNGVLDIVNGANLVITGSFSGNGVVDIGSGSSLTVLGSVDNISTINFEGSNTTLKVGQPLTEQNTITGFTVGDTIILENVTITTSLASYNPATGIRFGKPYFPPNYININEDPTILSVGDGNTTLIAGITTINTLITNSVQLGDILYANGVTISASGTVNPTSGSGIISPQPGFVDNQGFIEAANGAYGIHIINGSLINAGLIEGGTTAAAYIGDQRHSSYYTNYFLNSGTIIGSAGKMTTPGTTQAGGIAVDINATAFQNANDEFSNIGIILAGSLGGVGLKDAAAPFVNQGTISGGTGVGVYMVGFYGRLINNGVITASSGIAATIKSFAEITNTNLIESQSGLAVSAYAQSTLVNTGTILALNGSIAISGASSNLLNSGLISGGTQYAVYQGYRVNNSGIIKAGAGGAGVEVAQSGYLKNTGTILGGAGGGTGLIPGIFVFTSTINNAGTIIGGAGSTNAHGGLGVDFESSDFYSDNESFNFTNEGLVLGGAGSNFAAGSAGGIGLYANNYGSLIISGTVIGGAGGTLGGGSFGIGGAGVSVTYGIKATNTGTIIGGAHGGVGVYSDSAFAFVNQGTIASSSGYGVEIVTRNETQNGHFTGGTFVNAGLVVGSTYAVVFNLGTNSSYYQSPPVARLIVDPGAEFEGLVVSRTSLSTVEFAPGAVAGSNLISGFGTSIIGFSTIQFDGGSDFIIEGNSLGLAHGQTLSGFTIGDTIILDNFVVNTLDTTYVSGIGLELTDTLGHHITLDITGSFSTSSFIVVDPPGDTTIELATCYLPGTRIATPAGERAIETLRIGDPVITKFGGYQKIKWIGRQSFARRFIANNVEQIPVRILAGALGPNLPKRDLLISPGHSMLLGGVLVLAKNLINGITIRQDECPEQVDYYQLEFESHDCILAEGAWSESYADTPDWRAKFHNAAEFWALYPNHAAPSVQNLCAPRWLEGAELARAILPIVQRAAITARPGPLRGIIDELGPTQIRGWAQDTANPYLPVELDIIAGGRLAGRILACDPRADLRPAGIGLGHAAFTVPLPPGLIPADITLRRASDGAVLQTSHTARRAA